MCPPYVADDYTAVRDIRGESIVDAELDHANRAHQERSVIRAIEALARNERPVCTHSLRQVPIHARRHFPRIPHLSGGVGDSGKGGRRQGSEDKTGQA